MQCLSCDKEIQLHLPLELEGQFTPAPAGVHCRFSAGYSSIHDGMQASFYICDECISLNRDKLMNVTNFWEIFNNDDQS